MNLLLFLPTRPLLLRRRHSTPISVASRTPSSRRVARRPARACVPTPPSDQSQPIEGDPEWMQLARDLAPDSETSQHNAQNDAASQDKWNYPEGRLDEADSEAHNAWSAWNDAQSNTEQPLKPRDPKQETDFWRGAARDIVSEVTESASSSSPPDEMSSSSTSEVWQMARDVTGEMVNMQSKLRDELERYDSMQNVDEYRGIARELVGPPPELGDDARPIRGSADLDKGAEAGQGWNPDVDWMRFDDVQRELRKKSDKDKRKEVEDAARQNWEQQQSLNVEQNQEQQEKVWDTGTFMDQSTAPSFVESNSMPRFMRNRFMQSGTYGAGWSGAEGEMEQLRKEGIPLRDPKADAEQWRSVARELNLDVEGDIAAANEQRSAEGTSSMDVKPQRDETDSDTSSLAADESDEATTSWESWRSGNASWQSAIARAEERDPKKEVDMWRSSARELTKDDNSSDKANSDETASWESWRSGGTTWESANENIEERDVKKEVDMWRNSARELTSSTASDANAESPSSDLSSSDDAELQPSAWDSWRNANDRWLQSLEGGDMGAESSNDWRAASETQSDWGASLGQKTTSERAAWQAWERASGRQDSGLQQQWWDTRTDAVLRSESPRAGTSSAGDIDQWRKMAQQVVSDEVERPTASSEGASRSKEDRMSDDSAINSWKSVARDLNSESSSEHEE
eukprot:TRINITY_DN200_c0_g7_i1.p1 TRINITY_DN200_c0_g7~~TRINITY_DN200_c0_g7_i1.p1  ORF type:complete len:687 (+),score=134.53 TRINITY_DN200_c0_g7_i1:163-2223(+)